MRRAERAERRVAITLFNFPPNGGSVGTAAYLSVYESLYHTLDGLRGAGFVHLVPRPFHGEFKSLVFVADAGGAAFAAAGEGGILPREPGVGLAVQAREDAGDAG